LGMVIFIHYSLGSPHVIYNGLHLLCVTLWLFNINMENHHAINR
jgi:hypothetical protein